MIKYYSSFICFITEAALDDFAMYLKGTKERGSVERCCSDVRTVFKETNCKTLKEFLDPEVSGHHTEYFIFYNITFLLKK